MIIGFEWGLGELGRMVEETETPMIYELVLSLALIYNLHEHIALPYSSIKSQSQYHFLHPYSARKFSSQVCPGGVDRTQALLQIYERFFSNLDTVR